MPGEAEPRVRERRRGPLERRAGRSHVPGHDRRHALRPGVDPGPRAAWRTPTQDAIHDSFALAWKTCGGLRLVPTASNGQPAFALYQRAADGRWSAQSIQVLSLGAEAIAGVTAFLKPELPAGFGLPDTLTPS
jgi:hypothetical protein